MEIPNIVYENYIKIGCKDSDYIKFHEATSSVSEMISKCMNIKIT